MTDPWGVDEGYWDASGAWREVPAETRAALREAMGAGDDAPPPAPERPLWIVRPGDDRHLLGPCELVLEDGTQLRAEGSLPPDLPIGYHELRPLGEGPVTRVIVAPDRCHLPGDSLDAHATATAIADAGPARPGHAGRGVDARSWALAVQLHSCRSGRSWGIGDFGDLWRLGTWASAQGAGMVALNPLHAPRPSDRQEPSPYYPSSRRWLNPLYIRIDEIVGAADDPDVAALAAGARALNVDRLVDRDRVWRLKRTALERLWQRLGPDLRLERWRDEQGAALETYARFCTLVEHHHGTGWADWPAEHRHPSSPGVARFATERADRVAFWAWVQMVAHDQLARASESLPLLHDLAVGVDPQGADAWAHQDLLAAGVRIGAPPDRFNAAGQDWGLPPFVPWKLRQVGYAPLAELWRSGLQHGGGLRVDHVMGLFRLFWLPAGRGPAEGGYVRYRGDELLAVLAVESVRAGAVVIGEDLGTVEDEVRGALGAAGVLSSRLVWFEDGPPETFPRQAMAAVTTHDLPTVAGVWTGEDITDQQAAGVTVDQAAADGLRAKLADVAQVAPDAAVEDVVVAVHRRLAQAPSALVVATMEDALGLTRRPNVPGTTTERPNWSEALPLPLDDALAAPLVDQVTTALRQTRRAPSDPTP
jgi:4-alpha-glucanotransferase